MDPGWLVVAKEQDIGSSKTRYSDVVGGKKLQATNVVIQGIS